jgi:hypothetical protein
MTRRTARNPLDVVILEGDFITDLLSALAHYFHGVAGVNSIETGMIFETEATTWPASIVKSKWTMYVLPSWQIIVRCKVYSPGVIILL